MDKREEENTLSTLKLGLHFRRGYHFNKEGNLQILKIQKHRLEIKTDRFNQKMYFQRGKRLLKFI